MVRLACWAVLSFNDQAWLLKWQCHEIHEILLHFFISLIQPNLAPDKQVKIVSLKKSFLWKYSNLQFEKFDSPQANTARCRIDKLTKNVGLYWNSSPVFKKCNLLYQGKLRPAKKKMVPAKLRAVLACAESNPRIVSLRRVWLRAVLANFGFPQIF